MMRTALLVTSIAVTAAVGGCKKGNATGPDGLFIEVIITPSTANIAIGQELRLRAVVNGPPGLPQGIVWSTVDPEIATVTANGTVRGLSSGTARIRAAWTEDGTTFTDAHISVTDTPIEEGRGARRGR